MTWAGGGYGHESQSLNATFCGRTMVNEQLTGDPVFNFPFMEVSDFYLRFQVRLFRFAPIRQP
jgi:hypothetical protein